MLLIFMKHNFDNLWSGGATPGNPVSFGGHPSGLMGLLSHAGVAGSNPAAVAAASGLQQGQQVNMVPRRGHPAGTFVISEFLIAQFLEK